MKLPMYQVDAFTGKLFGGNPAAVVPLEEWLPAETMQAIAAENNLSETAFVIPKGDPYPLRWFTPTLEIDLCGHATLATAFVLFGNEQVDGDEVRFETQSGVLTVRKSGDIFNLDFPARKPMPSRVTEDLVEALGARPEEVLGARDLMAVFDTETRVRELRPRFQAIAELSAFAVMATAPGDEVDFVSRFFVPKAGIDEDPVTGSAHSTLIPYWSERLKKKRLHALQVSKRGGELFCEDRGPRVTIGGRAVEYLRGEIFID